MNTINKIKLGGIEHSISTVNEWKGNMIKNGDGDYEINLNGINLFKPIRIELYKENYDNYPFERISIFSYGPTVNKYVEQAISFQTVGDNDYENMYENADKGEMLVTFELMNDANYDGYFHLTLNLSKYNINDAQVLYKVYACKNNKATPCCGNAY